RSSTQFEHEVPGGTVKDCPTDGDIEEKPWRYIGYKGYTQFIASEDDFFLLRRFDVLNVRVGLALQDEISELEQDLEAMDGVLSGKDAEDFNNGTLRQDVDERSELIKLIQKKLGKYNKFLIQQNTLRKLSIAPRRDIKNLRNWHHNRGDAAIAAEEREYLGHKEDLIALAQKEKKLPCDKSSTDPFASKRFLYGDIERKKLRLTIKQTSLTIPTNEWTVSPLLSLSPSEF
ncbi:hypothetical protein BDP81DRAFT_496119, partial [Colletotrichum phormii]